jgi:hypothetical protein
MGDAINSLICNSGQIDIGLDVFQMFFTMLTVQLGSGCDSVSPWRWRNRLK